jgi:hypothetical protein
MLSSTKILRRPSATLEYAFAAAPMSQGAQGTEESPEGLGPSGFVPEPE